MPHRKGALLSITEVLRVGWNPQTRSQRPEEARSVGMIEAEELALASAQGVRFR